jgi:hypothetical protein
MYSVYYVLCVSRIEAILPGRGEKKALDENFVALDCVPCQ